MSSRLVEYEVWVRVQAPARSRFPRRFGRRTPVRTPDALHLASLQFLREREPQIRLATYDMRQATAATAMGIAMYDFDAAS